MCHNLWVVLLPFSHSCIQSKCFQHLQKNTATSPEMARPFIEEAISSAFKQRMRVKYSKSNFFHGDTERKEQT